MCVIVGHPNTDHSILILIDDTFSPQLYSFNIRGWVNVEEILKSLLVFIIFLGYACINYNSNSTKQIF